MLVLALAPAVRAQPEGAGPQLSITANGVEIDAGPAGKYSLPAPLLRGRADDARGEKPALERKDQTLIARYSNGAELQIAVSSREGTVTYSYSRVPPAATAFMFQMFVPIRFAGGGRFMLDDKETAFPATVQRQIVEAGWGERFGLVDPGGSGFRVSAPRGYQQLQDNRVFTAPVFVYFYNYVFANQPGKRSFAFKFGSVETTSAAAPVVDRFGQSIKADYPRKVRSEEALKADIASEAAVRQSAGPPLDRYGGLAGSRESWGLKKTGFFHVATAGARQVLVTPEGNLFFQLGVCGIAITDDLTLVAGRRKTYEWLPEDDDTQFKTAWRNGRPDGGIFSFYVANWIRKYGRPFDFEAWSAQAIERVRGWGFNSSGSYSRPSQAMEKLGFPTVAFLPLGAGDGVKLLPEKIGAAEVLDPFVPGTEAALDRRFAKTIAAREGDPLLIGYFLGNEQAFENLPKKIASYKASQVAAKARLVAILRDTYGDITKFNTAWDPPKKFDSFDALNEEALFIRTEAAARDMEAFYALYMDAYYAMVSRVFRRHDGNHLLLGSRLTPGTANNEVAVRAGGKYSDVISINYYSYPIEAAFLKQAHDWSGGRPLILSEWYYGSTDQGLGAGKEVKSQEERALGYRHYVEQAAALPYIVGSQWFLYGDQSITGRFFSGFNGEGNNTGLIDVTDRPYEALVAAASTSNHRIYDVMMGKREPFVFRDSRFTAAAEGGGRKTVAVPRALPGMQLDGGTTGWPGRPAETIESSRLVAGPANPGLRGDFRLAWDNEELHLLVQVRDATPLMNQREPARLWNGDGIELFIGSKSLGQGGSPIFSDRQILIGASKTPRLHVVDHADEGAAYKLLVHRDVSGEGYVVQVSMPWKALGIEPKTGLELLFDIAIDNSDDGVLRKQQLAWNGTAKNSGDRGAWGRARLVVN